MISRSFLETDTAIIGRSCVLPGARSPEDFWKICLNNDSQIKDVTEGRLRRDFVQTSDYFQSVIQSLLACEISDQDFEFYLTKHSLARHQSNRLCTYLTEGVDQLLAGIRPQNDRLHTDLILGCMNPDSDFELEILDANKKQYLDTLIENVAKGDEFRRTMLNELVEKTISRVTLNMGRPRGNFFATESLAEVAKKFNLSGEHFLIDAACASSLAALGVAVQRLQLGQADLVIAGGIESNLGYGSYLAFSSVGALAKKNSLPFDQRSEGIVQGEGVVLFAMKRLADAVRDGDTIHAVVSGVAGSSDGRSASLFQPNADGQSVVYKKLYGQNRRLSYLEAHGTGTAVGDQTEAKSITAFFRGQKFPFGSCKSLIGHAKGAAGAAGVLKSLFIMKERTVPMSSYIQNPVVERTDGPFLNTENVKIDEALPVRVGVNAFGFGGTNYHVLLEEFDDERPIEKTPLPDFQKMVFVSESRRDLELFKTEDFLKGEFPFRLPPKALSSIDKVQLVALLTAWSCIRDLGPAWAFVPKEKVNVISACTLFLDQITGSMHRMAYELINLKAPRAGHDELFTRDMQTFMAEKVLAVFPPMNEDSATGVLNNVIAGRICNAFDLYGKSYNIDKNVASVSVALKNIENELRIDPSQIFIFVAVEEDHEAAELKSIRRAVETRIITSASFAIENEFVALGEIVVTDEKLQTRKT